MFLKGYLTLIASPKGDKSCVSVNKNFCLGTIFFSLSGVCSHLLMYQTHYVDVNKHFILGTFFLSLSGVRSRQFMYHTDQVDVDRFKTNSL